MYQQLTYSVQLLCSTTSVCLCVITFLLFSPSLFPPFLFPVLLYLSPSGQEHPYRGERSSQGTHEHTIKHTQTKCYLNKYPAAQAEKKLTMQRKMHREGQWRELKIDFSQVQFAHWLFNIISFSTNKVKAQRWKIETVNQSLSQTRKKHTLSWIHVRKPPE